MLATTEMSNAKPTVKATMPQLWLNLSEVSISEAKVDCLNSVTTATAKPRQ